MIGFDSCEVVDVGSCIQFEFGPRKPGATGVGQTEVNRPQRDQGVPGKKGDSIAEAVFSY